MPSSHAQFIFFFCTYSALFVFKRWASGQKRCMFLTDYTNECNQSTFRRSVFQICAVCAFGGICCGGSVLQVRSENSRHSIANVPARHPRVHLLYHTPLQVAVGAGNGFVFAIAWYCFVTQVGPKTRISSLTYLCIHAVPRSEVPCFGQKQSAGVFLCEG